MVTGEDFSGPPWRAPAEIPKFRSGSQGSAKAPGSGTTWRPTRSEIHSRASDFPRARGAPRFSEHNADPQHRPDQPLLHHAALSELRLSKIAATSSATRRGSSLAYFWVMRVSAWPRSSCTCQSRRPQHAGSRQALRAGAGAHPPGHLRLLAGPARREPCSTEILTLITRLRAPPAPA